MAELVNSLGQLIYESVAFLGFWGIEEIGGTDTVASGILNNANSGSILEILRPFQNFGVGASILIIGATYMLGKSDENKEIAKNIFFVIVLVGLLPSIMTNGASLVKGTATELTLDQANLGISAVKNNTADVYTFVADKWQTAELKDKNHLDDFIGVDINETIDEPDEADTSGVLSNKIVAGKKDKEKTLEKLPEKSGAWVVGNLINMLIPRYYRWSINWIPAYVTVIALLVAIVLSLVRIGRLGMESAVNYIWGNIIAFFSFRDTTRFKTVVMQILVGFVTIISIFVLFFVFIYYMSFVNSVTENTWLRLFGIVGGCVLLYDGPAIIQQLFGVDAGLGTAGAVVLGTGLSFALRGTTGITKKMAASSAITGGFLSGYFGRKEDNSESASPNKRLEEKNQKSNYSTQEHNDKDNQEVGEKSIEDTKGSETYPDSVEEERNIGSEHSQLSEEEVKESEIQKKNSELEKTTHLLDENIKDDAPTSNNREKNQSIYQDEEEDSKNDEVELNEKPKNPVYQHLDKKWSTPPNQRKKGLYVQTKGSHTLGKEYREYREELKKYKKAQKSNPIEKGDDD
ncbi:hypothetical protein RV11_GL003173 [Enterococcus phoeniculicola]|nr:hypothetical protein RV11_GL003173 [Enterococcus phoeniculicola]